MALLDGASTLAALPIIVLFFFTQETFIEGISRTGIKGQRPPLPPTLRLTSSHSSTELYTPEFMAVRYVAKNVTQYSPAFTKLA